MTDTELTRLERRYRDAALDVADAVERATEKGAPLPAPVRAELARYQWAKQAYLAALERNDD